MGVAIRRNDLESDCELLWIELLSRFHTKTLLGVFYRPPSASPSYLANLRTHQHLFLNLAPSSYVGISMLHTLTGLSQNPCFHQGLLVTYVKLPKISPCTNQYVILPEVITLLTCCSQMTQSEFKALLLLMASLEQTMMLWILNCCCAKSSRVVLDVRYMTSSEQPPSSNTLGYLFPRQQY